MSEEVHLRRETDRPSPWVFKKEVNLPFLWTAAGVAIFSVIWTTNLSNKVDTALAIANAAANGQAQDRNATQQMKNELIQQQQNIKQELTLQQQQIKVELKEEFKELRNDFKALARDGKL